MTIETINNRIENAQKKLDKLLKKMARIEKAKASDYEENNPYYYSDYDYRSTTRDIADTKATLEKYTNMLAAEMDKAASRNVPVLVEFLNNWRDMARNWYNERRNGSERKSLLKKVENARKKYSDLNNNKFRAAIEVEEQVCKKNGWNYEDDKVRYSDDLYHHPEVENFRKEYDAKVEKAYNKYDTLRDQYNEYYMDIEGIEQNAYNDVKVAALKKMEAEYKSKRQKWVPWDHHVELTAAQKNKAWKDSLEKMLQREWDRKYDRLLEDVIRITGTIDDASGLRVNEKGDLDGYIIGKKGTAKVNTFGAGGYNIQCFHYRTKITRVK